jgi:hypothetical protein
MTSKAGVKRYESIQEPLDDEERTLMDPDTWDWESAHEIEPGPDPHLMFEVSLSGDDLARIDVAASAKGMTVGAYLRYAALQCALQPASG